MCFEPITRGPLSTPDVRVAHLLGDLTAKLRGILVTTHGRDIKPLVRLHEVDRYARACRINHAETEAIFGVCWFGSSGRNFHACHSGSPLFRPMRPRNRQILSPEHSVRAP